MLGAGAIASSAAVGGPLAVMKAIGWHSGWCLEDVGVANGADIASITDFTGNGRTMSEATNRPTFQLANASFNGRSSALFNGTNDRLGTSTYTKINQPLDRFVVFRLVVVGAGKHIFSSNTLSPGDRADFSLNGAGDDWDMYAGTEVTGGTPDTNPHLARIHFEGASSFIEIDGTQVVSGNPGTGGSTSAAFGNVAGLALANVEIAWGSQYAGTIGSTDLQNFEDAVETYYGITVA